MRTRRLCAGLTALLLTAGGCGTAACHVGGKVTFRGGPVPAGSVTFEPDTAAGGAGPSAVVEIVNGAYDVSPRKGLTGGKYRVRIIGPLLDPEKPGPQAILFPAYETTTDLPPGDTTRDFDVPPPK